MAPPNTAVQGAPPVVVSALSYFGDLDLEQALYALTIIYTVVQLAYTCWKWWRDIRSGCNKKENR